MSNIKSAVLFTANFRGGILQYTLYLAGVLARLGVRTTVFLPEDAEDAVAGSLGACRFNRFKSVRARNAQSAALAGRIAALRPDRVIFCDDTLISTETAIALAERCPVTMCIHDVSPHPAKFDPYGNAKLFLERRIRTRAVKTAGDILLLSKNSFEDFRSLYPSEAKKASWMMLGAHLPDASPEMPAETESLKNGGYFLFFGRISRYKGIIRPLKAYDMLTEDEKPDLVIAGNGALEPEEAELVRKHPRILLLNRYIRDGEMLWLVKNARAVALPYIEASQSGVIPIAYSFGVPVVTSDIPGLTEFVEDGVSGIVCRDIPELRDALLKLEDGAVRERLAAGALGFHRVKLNWEENVKRCILREDTGKGAPT
jgi:glycosyltransferase involved in cell wall biosynthesis